MFLHIFQHLLPKAKAWKITTNKQLRQFFDGLGKGLGEPTKLFFDQIWEDINPQKTRELDAWEEQFALPTAVLTNQERRDRVDAAWKAKGGQDPRYIENTLQAAGFNVYIHEWWVPGSEPAIGVLAAATARDPFTYLNDNISPLKYLSLDGGVDMQDGDLAIAQDGAAVQPTGYPLVNKILILNPDYINDGSLDMQDGDPLAQDGNVNIGGAIYKLKQYVIPTDINTHSYFLYIGGQIFPDHAIVNASRKNEFETLCLKICPAQQWLGILVDYT